MFLVLTLVAGLSLQDDPGTPVLVDTADGSRISGQLYLKSLKVSGDLGDLEIEISKIHSIVLAKEGDTITTSASVIRGRVQSAEFKVKTEFGTFTLAREKLKQITFVVARPPAAAIPPAGAPAAPKKVIPAENELKPVSVLKMRASLPDLILSKDRAWLFLLNTSEGKVQRLDIAKQTLDAAFAEVTEGTEGLCLAPNGSLLYGFTYAPPPAQGKTPQAKIHVIEAATLKVRSTFSIEFAPSDVQAGDSGFLYAIGQNGSGIGVIDTNKKVLAAKIGKMRPSGTSIRLTPDNRKAYYSTGGSPGNYECVILPSNFKDDVENSRSPYHGEHPIGGPFEISPDGKYLLSSSGGILRLAKNKDDDMKFAGRVVPHYASAVDRDGTRLVVVGTDATLKLYSYPAFELQKSFVLEEQPYRAVLDAQSGLLYAAVDPQVRPDYYRGARGVGDLHIYDLTKVLAAPLAPADPPKKKDF